jgi:hypothetical protein
MVLFRLSYFARWVHGHTALSDIAMYGRLGNWITGIVEHLEVFG